MCHESIISGNTAGARGHKQKCNTHEMSANKTEHNASQAFVTEVPCAKWIENSVPRRGCEEK